MKTVSFIQGMVADLGKALWIPNVQAIKKRPALYMGDKSLPESVISPLHEFLS